MVNGGQATIIASSLVNTGTVADVLGTLNLDSSQSPNGVLFVNDGQVTVDNVMIVGGPVTASAGDTGQFVVNQGATLDFAGGGNFINPLLDGPVGASQTITLIGDDDTLIINDPSAFAGTIDGFTAGDVVDVGGFEATQFNYASGILTLQDNVEVSQGVYSIIASATLALPGINPADIALLQDFGNDGGTDIRLSTGGALPFPASGN